jgi:hypothetical protein
MWARTLLVAMGMWAQTCTGRSRHVGADATAGMVLVGADVFLEMIVSQKLVFGCRVRFVSNVQKKLVLLSLLHVLITTFVCIINYTYNCGMN